MFKMRATAFPGGDCTAPYAVMLDKEYTVEEFVNAVLTNKAEWGYIGIEHKGATFGAPNCEYKYGHLLNELPQEVLCEKVVSARAHGGWTRMDYYLTINKKIQCENIF